MEKTGGVPNLLAALFAKAPAQSVVVNKDQGLNIPSEI